MPRVLILSENESVPSDRRVWDVSVSLERAGWEVEVVCPRGSEHERASQETIGGVRVHRYPLRFAEGGVGGYLREYLSALWHTWRLVRRLSRQKPFDVVHACNPPDFLLFAAWPARRSGARFIFDHHDLTPELFLTRFGASHRWLYRLTLLLERLCFAVADVVISVNDSYREVATTRGRKASGQVFVVRNGPDLKRFRPVPPDPSLRRGQQLLISYVGVMAPQDGVEHAIRALALVGRHRADWHAVFAGEGPSRTRLTRLADELGLGDRVEFTGWLDDDQIARLLCTSDVCLAPEPLSPLNDVSTMVKIAEYMAMSRPIVAYALRESQVAAGGAALYAEPNKVAAFAACIEQLLSNPRQREEMGRVGRARVEQDLSWERSEQFLARAYRSVLNGRAETLGWAR